MSKQPEKYETPTERVENNAKAVFVFIRTYIDKNGISPTLDEISKGCFMSRGSVVRYLDRLEARGDISRQYQVPRSIVVRKRN